MSPSPLFAVGAVMRLCGQRKLDLNMLHKKESETTGN